MFTNRALTALLTCLLLLFISFSNGSTSEKKPAQPAGGSAHLNAQVMSSGGAPTIGSGRRANGTLGQSTPIGSASRAGKALDAGFWGPARGWTPTGTSAPIAYPNRLFQNYPNPFNPTTTVKYSIAQAGRVEMIIYSVGGQRIKTLIDERKPAGSYKAVWNGRNDSGLAVASGVYFCRLKAGTFSSVKKLVLLK